MDKIKCKNLCEFCGTEIPTIPIIACDGKLVCYEHFNTDSNLNYCFFCNEHKFDVKNCLETSWNQLRIKKNQLETNLNQLNRDIQDLKLFTNDPSYFLNESFDNLKWNVDLKREELKQQLIEKIDKYYEELMLKIRLKYEEHNNFLKDLKSINFEQIEAKINSILVFNDNIENDQTRNIENKINLVDNQTEKVKLLFEEIESFKSAKDEIKFYRLENSIIEQELNIENLFGHLNFELKFSDRFKGELTKTCKGHTETINDVKILKTDEILTCSDDSTMKLWDTNSGNCLRTFKGHSDSVLCIEILKNGEILTGSCDELIKIWHKDTGECIRNIKGHCSSVKCLLALEKNNIDFISGSDDSKIMLWKNKQGFYSRQILYDHSDGISCLNILSSGELVSSSYDKTIKIWDLESKCCIRSLYLNETIDCFKPLNQNQIIASIDKTIKLINIENGKCLKKFDEHNGPIWSLELIGNNEIISCSKDMTIKIWNLFTGKNVKTIKLDSHETKCLKVLENGRIITGSSNLKIWK